MNQEEFLEKHVNTMMRTQDPETNMPALTTLLYRVCDNNPEKFDEANRLLVLFLDQKAKEPNT